MLVQVFALVGTVIIGFHEMLLAGSAQWGVRAQGWFWYLLDGKVQAMLFLFAGVALHNIAEHSKGSDVRRTILREGGMLVLLGTVSSIVWPSELLLSLGLCCILSIPFVLGNRKLLWPSAALFALLMPLCAIYFDLDRQWDFNELQYQNFWSPGNLPFRLFINGYYPVFSWMPYVLVGIWLGKFRLDRKGIRPTMLWLSLLALLITGVGSVFMRIFGQLILGYGIQGMELFFLFRLEKIHAMPMFTIHNMAWALFLTASLSMWREALPDTAHRFIAGMATKTTWILFAQAIVAMSIIRLSGLERSLSINQSWLIALGWLTLVGIGIHFLGRRK